MNGAISLRQCPLARQCCSLRRCCGIFCVALGGRLSPAERGGLVSQLDEKWGIVQRTYRRIQIACINRIIKMAASTQRSKIQAIRFKLRWD